MRCEELKERFIDLLYDEKGTPPASAELQAHMSSCAGCREELEELRGARSALRTWQEEAPLLPVSIPRAAGATAKKPFTWMRPLRYAAVAAAVVLGFLALSNAELHWSKDQFSFRTHLFASKLPPDVYTKAELRDILKRVLDDSEGRILETNYLMLQRMLETLEQERLNDMRSIREQVRRSGEKN